MMKMRTFCHQFARLTLALLHIFFYLPRTLGVNRRCALASWLLENQVKEAVVGVDLRPLA